MRRLICSLMVAGFAFSGRVEALPFNDDMVDNQISDGQVSRKMPEGTIARGSLSYRVESKEHAATLTNPIKGDRASTVRGERLYQVNCTPCHGDITRSDWQAGEVGKPGRLPGVPNIALAPYSGYSDGKLYATIHFGGAAIMPAYGWKLSPTEHWDIVNYLRKAQEATR